MNLTRRIKKYGIMANHFSKCLNGVNARQIEILKCTFGESLGEAFAVALGDAFGDALGDAFGDAFGVPAFGTEVRLAAEGAP
jgi:hypothetical protein